VQFDQSPQNQTGNASRSGLRLTPKFRRMFFDIDLRTWRQIAGQDFLRSLSTRCEARVFFASSNSSFSAKASIQSWYGVILGIQGRASDSFLSPQESKNTSFFFTNPRLFCANRDDARGAPSVYSDDDELEISAAIQI